jgi:vacuolar-type H+-ATPase subunit I/STV1
MNSKEKARDLVHTFYYTLPNNGSQEGLNSTTSRYQESIQCALIAVDEILKNDLDFFNQLALTNKSNKTYLNSIEYWEEVKQEIELL